MMSRTLGDEVQLDRLVPLRTANDLVTLKCANTYESDVRDDGSSFLAGCAYVSG